MTEQELLTFIAEHIGELIHITVIIGSVLVFALGFKTGITR